ncbi:carboxypeptidase regulatory-like domain-containing protein [Nannocystis punicea]|uniref:Carboxypeptidase regulatory-like domain-containing protein n=1 Tax=Nannocystis punicea TaxID=2995304 RepID=A0ABY7H3T9_9BACT|nr:carboxypeptidase regulatory-like domain-containing protein [Nannocystis poenicansa]WAS93862.1 carboxypeptidase regulatory-like domain-containing protein [Nannocystis poenicansa]
MRGRVVGAALVVVIGGVLWWLREGDDGALSAANEVVDAPVQATAGGGRAEVPALVLEPRLGARASVSGFVKDAKGRPVAGAQVCAVTTSERLTAEERRRPACVTSERDGHYRIAGLFGVRHEVIGSAPGFMPTLHTRGEGPGRREWIDLRAGMELLGVDIELADGGVEVRGVVKDLSGGPIEGARLMGHRQSAGVTGPEGEFSMWVRPGEVGLQAVAEGYAPARDNGVAPGHFYEIFMTPEAVLVGKVVRAGSNEPLADVRVSSGGASWASTMTDAQGVFRLDALQPGAYKPSAASDEVFGQADELVMLGLGETSEPLVIPAHPAFFVEGRVVIEGGGDCDFGSVMLRDGASGRSTYAGLEGDGVVRLKGLRPGEYKVDVRCEGHVPEDMYEAVKVVDRSLSGVQWKVTRGRSIRGVVVDARGRPVEKMTVNAGSKPDPGRPHAQRIVSFGGSTDASGRFEVAGLLPGLYEVVVSAWEPPRAAPRPLEVALPKGQDVEGVRIELPAVGEVRGTVRDANGKPVRGASVSLSGGANRFSRTVADDGAFRIEHVGAGEYRAEVQKGWEKLRAPGTSDDDVQGEKIEVRADAVTTVNLVVASASGKISGVVRDEHGAPVADAFVDVGRESDSAGAAKGSGSREARWTFGKRPNLTDAEGRFTLTDLSDGKHTLRAHRRYGAEAILEHVAIGSEVTLTLPPAARLAGMVALPGGGAPEEFQVVIHDAASGYRRNDQFYRTNGAWSFPEVPAGEFKVQVSSGAGNAETMVKVTAGEELSGVRIELAPRVTVRGTVVDLEGKPVPGLTVMVSGGGSGSSPQDGKHNLTDESGRFEFRNAPTGLVQVSVSPQSATGEFGWSSMPTMLSAEASTVELPPIRLARKRIATGEPPGDLGLTTREPASGEDPTKRRWIVAHVRPRGPAALAGVAVGDEIVSVDGQDVQGPNSYLFPALTHAPAKTTVTLGLARGAHVQVTIGARP